MKLYDCSTAPSPRRVRIFLAEKGISVPTIQVDLRNGEQFGETFRAINPDGTVPVLVLDDGARIADIVGICRYFEETQPMPPLMGIDAADKAVVESWQRWCERECFYAVMDAFRNSTPGLKGRALPGPDPYEQIPALAERSRTRITRFLERLNERLAANQFVAGERFTIADITALVSIDFAGWAKVKPAENLGHLKRWHQAVSARPSAKA
ncbi:MAG TPA: glutathione S-transferase [Candidatus Cybelea sp.]|nr:glutathione S-transferase [Candidatus Cybelea sp.]